MNQAALTSPLHQAEQPLPKVVSDYYDLFVERLGLINPGKTAPSIASLLEFAGEEIPLEKIPKFGELLHPLVDEIPYDSDHYFELFRPLRNFYLNLQYLNTAQGFTPLIQPNSAVQILGEVMTCALHPALEGYAEECLLSQEDKERANGLKLLAEFKRDASGRLELYKQQTEGLENKLTHMTETRSPDEISQLLEESGKLAKLHSEISNKATALTRSSGTMDEDPRIAGEDQLNRFSQKIVELAEARQPELAQANQLKEAALAELALVSIDSWKRFFDSPNVKPHSSRMISQSLQKLRDHPKKREDISGWVEAHSQLAEERLRPKINCEFTFCVHRLEELLHYCSTKEFNFEPIRRAELMAPVVYWMINNPGVSPF